MKYMLLIYTDEKSYAEGEREQCYGGVHGADA